MSHNNLFRALLSICFILSATISSGFAHAELYVIINSATQIGAGDIKDVFTGEKQVSGSTKLIPVDNGAIQEAFLSTVLKLESARYKSIWTKKSFRDGMTAPAIKSGDSEVLEFVRKTPGAIGYVGSPPSGVTVVQKY